MDALPDGKVPPPAEPRWLKLGLPAFALALLIIWLALTPDGLLGKLDAIGCAVCHRIEERSFLLAERPLPLCARCTGLFLGVLIGLAVQALSNKPAPDLAAGLPPRRYWVLFVAFALFYALDGLNSYITLLTPAVYLPNNALRLSSGLLFGLAVSAFLLPLFHQGLFAIAGSRPVLASWKTLAWMLAISFAAFLLIYSANPFILYPIALLSSLTVWLILGMAYTVILQVLLPRAVTYPNLRAAWLPLLGGFSLALLQILVTDLLRLALTGNWNGLMI